MLFGLVYINYIHTYCASYTFKWGKTLDMKMVVCFCVADGIFVSGFFFILVMRFGVVFGM